MLSKHVTHSYIMSEFGGPRRRVASRKRSGSHTGREIDKRAKDAAGNQSLVTVSQRCDADETDAGLICEGTSQWVCTNVMCDQYCVENSRVRKV